MSDIIHSKTALEIDEACSAGEKRALSSETSDEINAEPVDEIASVASKLLDDAPAEQPLSAFRDALQNGKSLAVALAILRDPRCGLEQRWIKMDGDLYREACYIFEGATPLLISTTTNRTDVTMALLRMGLDVNVKTEIMQNTPLHYIATQQLRGVKEGNYPTPQEVAALMLAKGAKIDVENRNGSTPVQGIGCVTSLPVVRLLLEHGAPVSGNLRCDNTPLHSAAVAGNPALVKLLLNNGANVNARSKCWDFTPLHFAAERQDVKTIKLLLAEGAKLSMKCGFGKTPLQVFLDSRKPKKNAACLIALLTER